MKHVVIVGAGVSGLATAFHVTRLARSRGIELRTTVLEADARPGGRVWTERCAGFQVELGANGFLDSKPFTLELCTAIGLGAELIAARDLARRRFIFWHDELHALPNGPGGLMRSRLLSWRGKLRLLAELFVPRRRTEKDESVHEFACRRVGHEAAEVLVDAMVTGIHAGDATLLSAAAAFPGMVQLEREHGSLLRAMPRVRPQRQASPGGKLWSLRGGMGQLIERLTDHCGADLIRGATVRHIQHADSGAWLVRGEGADVWSADAIVLACPSPTQAAILERIDTELSRLVGEIQYNSIAGVALGYREADMPRPLDGFGYLSPGRTRRDVLGVLWSSSIFENRAPPGTVLLQAMCGGWNRPDIISWHDERLVGAVRDELRHTLGVHSDPIFVRVIRWPQAIPQYHVGHLNRVAAIEARRRWQAGLYLTGNSFRGVSVNDCTQDARRCALELLDDLCNPKPGGLLQNNV